MSLPNPLSGSMRPTLDTRFYIDYTWWENSTQDIRLMLRTMCSDLGIPLEVPDGEAEAGVDWVNPHTGQVSRLDMFHYTFLNQCAGHEEFIHERMTLIESVFRALLAAGNQPMTSEQLAQSTGRPAAMILKTLSGRQIYKGIRPYTPGTAE